MFDLASQQEVAASNITRCYRLLAEKKSNVVCELIQENVETTEWQHFPKDDVKDKLHHTQYFYHAHASQDQDRVPEHGHFHLFLRPGLISRELKPIVISEKYTETQGEKDNLCHLIAIAMNEKGLPTALFTVNYWITLGIWYPADVIVGVLDQFVVDIPNSPFALTNEWVTNMIRLFRDTIVELLYARDEVVLKQQQDFPERNVFYDKSLEITSVCRFL